MINNKHYPWQEIENYVLEKTKESDYYANPNKKGESYSIIMPPPNVTGFLHMGHALVTTLQDVLVRYHRMQGYNVLWQPGVDHAGIATQAVVEKQLAQKGIKRQDLGRESFIEKVYQWKETSSGGIIKQIKRMGSTCDFSYLAFTMDNQSIKGVYKAFEDLYAKGLIYQDNRLVNWDCKLQTAISDLEVEQKEIQGKLYYLKYYLVEDKNKYIEVATTRPETIFGDVVIAVNPQDSRYTHIIGKKVIIPICEREIPIIADEYPDMTKGSGAVKITPGHDFNDFEVGQRHNLKAINILNKDGTLNSEVPQKYQGLNIEQARKKVLTDLTDANLLAKEEEKLLSIPTGDRSNTTIEPLLTKQWFLNAKELAEPAIEAVKSGQIEFIPHGWNNTYFAWMENIKPWCISRQLWWGHRLPVWYADGRDNKVFVSASKQEAQWQAKEFYGEDVELKQDEDVLDTWFSSSLWAFVTMGWPNNTIKLQKYYPTSCLITGFDIIFFWVARMIMMGLHFMQEVPFKQVYINALVRDEQGNKMSKSKGNVIDPLQLMEKYSTDALRFTLVNYSAHAKDIKLSEKTVEGYRNFITKIWNSFKFCLQNDFIFEKTFKPNNVVLNINKWILYKLQKMQDSMEALYQGYRFNDISNSMYTFIWGDFCDWYIEFSKSILYNQENETHKTEVRQTMAFVFDAMLKIINPVIPFISQYLFEILHNNKEINIALESFPKHAFSFDKSEAQDIDLIINFIVRVRSMKAEFNIGGTPINIHIVGSIPTYVSKNISLLKKMLKVKDICSVQKGIESSIQDVANDTIISIPLKSVIDISKEIERITKQIEKLKLEIEKVNQRLNNPKFMTTAPQNIIAVFVSQKEEIAVKILKLQEILNKLQG